MRLTDEEILNRIRIGREFMKPRANIEWRRCLQFRDPEADLEACGSPPTDDGDAHWNNYADTDIVGMPIGLGNAQTANVLVKIAANAIGAPQVQVTIGEVDAAKAEAQLSQAMGDEPTGDPEMDALVAGGDLENLYAQVVPLAFDVDWRNKRWRRECVRVYQKCELAGPGFMFYRWDNKTGVEFEAAHGWDVFVDPFVKQWERAKWGGRRITISAREAVELYGAEKLELSRETGERLDEEKIVLWLYWDRDEEIVVHQGKVIHREDNKYGAIPYVVMSGDVDPNDTEFPLSGVLLTAGLQTQITDIQKAIQTTVVNGKPLNIINSQLLTKAVDAGLEDAKSNGWVVVRDKPQEAFLRIGAEGLSNAPITALQMCMDDMDAIMGTNSWDRGVSSNARSATESTLMATKAAPRQVKARVEYEEFVREMAERWLDCMRAFGGPSEGKLTSYEDMTLWQACMAVSSLTIGERSTSYKDPSTKLMPLLQIMQAAAQIAPLCAQMGMPVPNVAAIYEEVLHAAGYNEVAKFQTEAPQPQGQQGPAGEMPQGDPIAEQGVQ